MDVSNWRDKSLRWCGGLLFVVGAYERAVGWLSGSVAQDSVAAFQCLERFVPLLRIFGFPHVQASLMLCGTFLIFLSSTSRIWTRRIATPANVPDTMCCPQCKGGGKLSEPLYGVSIYGTREIQHKIIKCDFCDGYGLIPGYHLAYPKCKVCEATGQIRTPNGQSYYRCSVCKGIGHRSPLENKLTAEITLVNQHSKPEIDPEDMKLLEQMVKELDAIKAIPVLTDVRGRSNSQSAAI